MPKSIFQGVMVINHITSFLLFLIYLSGRVAYSLPLVSDIEGCLWADQTTPCAEPLTLQDETFTNELPIVASVSICYWTDETLIDFHYIGTETQEGQINIFFFEQTEVLVFSSGYEFHVCDTITVHLDPVASGNYILNYYLMDETPLDRSEWSTRLQDSKSIVVEKTVDNEPPIGRVLIAGDAIEDRTLTFEATDSIHDADGLGILEFQWYRNDQPIWGAITDHYVLTDEDVAQDISLMVSYIDGQGKTEQLSSLAAGMGLGIQNVDDPLVGSAIVHGSLTEGATLTVDTSSLADADGFEQFSYRWIRHYGISDLSSLEVGTDSDSYDLTSDDVRQMVSVIVTQKAGISASGSQILGASVESQWVGPIGPATVPLVEAPEDQTVPASGNLTQVDVGQAHAQNDQGEAVETYISEIMSNDVEADIPSDGQFYLQPGTHTLKWSLVDEHLGGAQQIVRVDPIITFGQDNVAATEGPFECPLVLNGQAARYPVVVPYRVSGTLKVDLSERVLYENELRLYGTEQQPTVRILATLVGDATEYESLLLSMDTPTNAVAGEKQTCRIMVGDDNYAPRVRLTAYQSDVPIRMIDRSAGSVRVIASVDDKNIVDTHLYDWSATDYALIDTDNQEETFTFDPTSVELGLYRVRVTVRDSSASDTTELSLRLVDEFSGLSDSDSDGDGETDQAEGYGDQDGDGVLDYLDSSEFSSHQLSQQPQDSWGYLLETESGLSLTLGDIAFYSGGVGAWITWNDILEADRSGFGTSTDLDGSLFDAGLYDFQVAGLVGEGGSVEVVIPQRQSISSESVFRKLMPQGWGVFEVDEHNRIQSAPGEAGRCPLPVDGSYTDGLQEGFWCVALMIEDGGPNDADEQANGKLLYTGGVSKASNDEGSEAVATTEDSSGGGGLMSLWMLLVLSGMMFGQLCHRSIIVKHTAQS